MAGDGEVDDEHMERLRASGAPMGSHADLQAFLRTLEDQQMNTQRTTTDGQLPNPGLENAAAPKPIDPETGQHGAYYILSASERAKGFIRPVRTKYVHVGVGGSEIDPTNRAKHGRTGQGCGAATSMRQDIAETYARNPAFYSSTFCCSCGKHLPVAEFKWDGTDQVVGS